MLATSRSASFRAERAPSWGIERHQTCAIVQLAAFGSMLEFATTFHAPETLVEGALLVLQTADPWEKARITDAVVKCWKLQQLKIAPDAPAQLPVPARPARADDKVPGSSAQRHRTQCTVPLTNASPRVDHPQVKLVEPGNMPRLGKGGTLASRQAIVHSLTHIENWAVDLSWDIIARFGQDPDYAPHLPVEFFDDFVRVRLPQQPAAQGHRRCHQ
jgi:uncharacterized ferritin-like protein (DUF455 family)